MNRISENKEACDDHDIDIAFISHSDEDIFNNESCKASEKMVIQRMICLIAIF